MSQTDVGLHYGFNISGSHVKTGEWQPYGLSGGKVEMFQAMGTQYFARINTKTRTELKY
jgi:hypothetical protein